MKILTNSQGKLLMNQQGKFYKAPVIPVEAEENDVNFYDYDGFRVASYTKEEFANITELPPNPIHDGLTAQGWNWNLADAKAAVADCGYLSIGQNYITDDGKTRIYITFAPNETKLSLPFNFRQTESNGVSIDWGDGSADETVSGTGKCRITHTYAKAGSYVIKLDVTSGTLILGGASREGLFYDFNSSPISDGTNYSLALKNVELGSNVTEIGAYCPTVTRGSIGIETITVPTGCDTSVEAFYSARKLKFCVIPSGVTSVKLFMFNGCTALKDFCIPKSATTIVQGNFTNIQFQKVVIPNGVQTLDSSIFQYAYGMSYVVIPSSVTSIGNYCFADTYTSLHNVYVYATTPPTLGASVFRSAAADLTIHVPYSEDHSILNTYKTTTNWLDYANNIIEMPNN